MLVTLVVNPVSGKQRGEQIAREAGDRLSRAGHDVVRVHSTDGAQGNDSDGLTNSGARRRR